MRTPARGASGELRNRTLAEPCAAFATLTKRGTGMAAEASDSDNTITSWWARGSAGLRAREPALGGPKNRVLVWRPAGATAGFGFTSPSATSSPSAIRARTGCSPRRRSRAQRTPARLSPRQGDRRLVGHQRHDLHARPGGRLRRLAQLGLDGLGLGRRAALLPQARGTMPTRRTASTPGAEWRVEHPPRALGHLDAVRDAAAACRHRQEPGLQHGDNEGSPTSR
jgi:hypothetical protein